MLGTFTLTSCTACCRGCCLSAMVPLAGTTVQYTGGGKKQKEIKGMKAVNLQICRRRLLWEWVIAEQRLMPKSFRGIFFIIFFPVICFFHGETRASACPRSCGTAAACPDCIPGLCHLASMKPKPARTPALRAEHVAGSCCTCAGCVACRAHACEQCNERTALN